jgi:hypothetical protein
MSSKIRTLQKLPAKKYNPKQLVPLAAKAAAVPIESKPIPTRVNLKKRSAGKRNY